MIEPLAQKPGVNDSIALWRADEVRRATGGTVVGSEDWTANGVSIDTRSLQPGDLFIALTGLNQDGHAFLDKAFENGAAAALVSDRDKAQSNKGPCVLVPDTQTGMEALGTFARDRTQNSKQGKRIAVTGSVGKTSTKEMLRTVLSDQGQTHASVASYNNLWGVPLTLARMPAETEFGVFEIGMNHAGEITPLTKQVQPHAAIITTVAPVHLEFFKDVAAIAMAKAEIFDGLVPGGTAILNRDNEFYQLLADTAAKVGDFKKLSFGEHEQADCHLHSYKGSENGADIEATICGQSIDFHLSLPGKHQAMNALSVLAAVHAIGADVETAAQSLGHLEPVSGRGEVMTLHIDGKTIDLVDESYNANPASMASALETLGQREIKRDGRRIAILGDMLELGSDGPELHRKIALHIEQAKVEAVYLAGPLMKSLWEVIPQHQRGAYAQTAAALTGAVKSGLQDGDVLVVKGSLGSKMGQIVSALKDLNEDRGTPASRQAGTDQGRIEV